MCEPVGSTLGDLSQAFQFFGAVYAGTPLVLTYGETSLATLDRRLENCREIRKGKGQATKSTTFDLAENALEDLRIAVARPIVSGRLKGFLGLAALHICLGLIAATVAAVAVPTWLAAMVLGLTVVIFAAVAVPGVVDVIRMEAAAVNMVARLELEVRSS